jgi:hypothetical protein
MAWLTQRRAAPRTAIGGRDWPRYPELVSGPRVPGGVVHKLPSDLRQALVTNAVALDAWKDITPLARNEFICWVEDAGDDPGTPDPPDAGGARGGTAPALLLARMRPSRADGSLGPPPSMGFAVVKPDCARSNTAR